MELIGGNTLTVSNGTALSSAEADIQPIKQVNKVVKEKDPAGVYGWGAVTLGSASVILDIPIFIILETLGVQFNPLLLVIGGWSLMTSTFWGLCYFDDKKEFLVNIMDNLGLEDKNQRKAFSRAIKKLPKGTETTFVSEADKNNSVKVWKLTRNKLVLCGVKNPGDDWEHTLDNITDVYSLRKETSKLTHR